MEQIPVKNSIQIESPHTDDWLRLFNKENVQFTILDLHADAELVKAIRSQPEWTIDFEEEGEGDMNENWLQCFEEQNVQFAVLSQSQDEELVKTLRRQPGWSVDFEDDEAVIFARCAENGRGNELL
jgi:predicted dithiol-disulfide oxidoreductase (DUF899 family)